MTDDRSAPARLTRADILWLLAALCVGGLLIFWRLADKSLVPDEAFYYRESIASLPRLIHITVYGNFHPPLFYLVFHYINAVLHLPAADYRYFTAPFGLVTIGATWALARRWFGSLAGGLAGLVVATQPLLVSIDRLFWMYEIVTALALVSWWLLLEAADADAWRRRWLWLAYGAIVIAMPYTLYLGALVVAAQGLYALVRRNGAWPALAWGVIAALALVPWWWAIRIQLPNGAFPGATFGVRGLATAVLLMTPPERWTSPAFDAVLLTVSLAIVAAACWLGRRTALPYLFVPLLIQVIVSYGFHRDLLLYRYIALWLPAFAIAIAAVAARLLASRIRVAGLLLIILVLAGNATALANFLFDPYYQSTDWYAIEIAMHKRSQPGDILIFNQMEPYLVVEDSPDVKGHELMLMSYPYPPEVAVKWLDAHPHSRVWYVENQADFSDPDRVVATYLAKTRPLLYSTLQKHSSVAYWALLQLYGEANPARR